MKKAFVVFLGVALLCFFAADANAVKNANGKWALHDAGAHNSKTHTCAYALPACTGINILGPSGPGTRDDVYIIAVDVAGISGTRYGLCCDGGFFFYGWTKCSDYEIPSTGWPGCGEGNAQTWTVEKAGPYVNIGILDVYAYAGAVSLCVCVDPRVSYAEWCDGTEPSPICFKVMPENPQLAAYFGCIGYGGHAGYNPCSIVATEEKSWGAVKSLYR